MDLAADATGSETLQIEDWDVMFVARGLSGPFVAGGDTIDGGHGRVACRMTLRDEGNGNRVIASALAVFRRSS